MRTYEVELATRSIDGLSLRERPSRAPRDGEVRVRLRAASLNFRDLLIAKGLYPVGGDFTRLVPVSDAAGEVIDVGPGVTRFAPGDRVVTSFFQGWLDGPLTYPAMNTSLGGAIDGVLADEFVLSEQGLVAMPDAVSFDDAATLPCAGVTAWHALVESGQVRAGQTVLLLGTGGVSIFGLQIAKAKGARVIITSSSDEKLARAKAMGADGLINYKTTPDWERQVLELTGGAGADHVLETGGAGTLPKSLQSVAIHGQVNIIGVFTGLENKIDFLPVLIKTARIQGIFVGSRAMLETLITEYATRTIRPVIDKVFGFEQALEAYHYMDAAQHFGKVLIRN